MGKLHEKHGKRSNAFAGKMAFQLPHYVNLRYDETRRKATMTVDDRKIRKQREMWGEFLHDS